MRRLRCFVVLLLSLLATAGPVYAGDSLEEKERCIPELTGVAPGSEDICPYGRT